MYYYATIDGTLVGRCGHFHTSRKSAEQRAAEYNEKAIRMQVSAVADVAETDSIPKNEKPRD